MINPESVEFTGIFFPFYFNALDGGTCRAMPGPIEHFFQSFVVPLAYYLDSPVPEVPYPTAYIQHGSHSCCIMAEIYALNIAVNPYVKALHHRRFLLIRRPLSL